MNRYSNGMFKSDFKRSQAAYIYKLAKDDKLQIERWLMSEIYDLTSYYGYDDNRSVERFENKVKFIYSFLEEKDFEGAQEIIDELTEDEYKLMGKKNSSKIR